MGFEHSTISPTYGFIRAEPFVPYVLYLLNDVHMTNKSVYIYYVLLTYRMGEKLLAAATLLLLRSTIQSIYNSQPHNIRQLLAVISSLHSGCCLETRKL